MPGFAGYQTDELATWVGLLEAIDLYRRHQWTAWREPLPPPVEAARRSSTH